MSKTIAFANQKGGVGKTTSCVNLAASIASKQHRVLLIDLDPQGNTTMGSGIDKRNLQSSINEVLLDEVDIITTIISTKAGYDLVPANRDLTAAEVQLLPVKRCEQRLLQAISKIKGSYDYIFIDCPPALSMLTVNALVASDSVIIPMQCEYYALEGISGLVETLQGIQTKFNPKLTIDGILRTMYDPRNRLTNEVSDQLFEHFKDKVFTTVIPRNIRLAEAPSYGLPALLYDRTSQGAKAYLDLADELLAKRKQEFHSTAKLAINNNDPQGLF